jgi:hypothetical protein
MKNTTYTVEMYRLDKRCKEGRKLSYKVDIPDVTYSDVERLYPVEPRYVREIHETYVTRTNLMSGLEYQERYDTPNFCSASSETFWST